MKKKKETCFLSPASRRTLHQQRADSREARKGGVMKIISKVDGTVVATVMTNHAMSLDDAMTICNCPWIVDEEDIDNTGYKVGDVYYSEDDLFMEY